MNSHSNNLNMMNSTNNINIKSHNYTLKHSKVSMKIISGMAEVNSSTSSIPSQILKTIKHNPNIIGNSSKNHFITTENSSIIKPNLTLIIHS